MTVSTRLVLFATASALTLYVAICPPTRGASQDKQDQQKSVYDWDIRFDITSLTVDEKGDLKSDYPQIKSQADKAIELARYFNLNEPAEFSIYATVTTRILNMKPGQSIRVDIKGRMSFKGKFEVTTAEKRMAVESKDDQ